MENNMVVNDTKKDDSYCLNNYGNSQQFWKRSTVYLVKNILY